MANRNQTHRVFSLNDNGEDKKLLGHFHNTIRELRVAGPSAGASLGPFLHSRFLYPGIFWNYFEDWFPITNFFISPANIANHGGWIAQPAEGARWTVKGNLHILHIECFELPEKNSGSSRDKRRVTSGLGGPPAVPLFHRGDEWRRPRLEHVRHLLGPKSRERRRN